ncbi:helix-turn-helix transcriptional regulator [Amylibacter sp. SFDW26]|uniref:winged helix-turn-helix transcriptional regulator n=1 Tax=Amylibacter sp. SFDW26 TaxID=2652722 RepID=UPI00126150F2|nr:helix-turn-helix domain-containing protein [Amylibacter sp. SFDW26]KAB7615487.1 helix-turn-helix transcriptional regulator [Amylibacter sp. SFDW26]
MENTHRSGCPISTSLEVIGDKWTLILIRDMLCGKKRYGDFLDSPEKITTNILASRLSDMERYGLVTKQLYNKRPKRFEYVLTPMGSALKPIVQSMCIWGNSFFPETWVPPKSFMAPD